MRQQEPKSPSGDGEAVVKIRVNDGIKNTLNDKWAEKEYTISVLTSLDSLKEAIDDLPGADSIDKDNYQQYKNTVSSLTAACDALSDQQREQIGQTSIQKLALVSEKISLLSLEAAKEKAAAELEAYQDEEGDYTAENWEKVLSAKKTGRENIFKAATESEVLRVLTEAKAAVYAVTKKDMGQSAKDVSLKSIMLLPGEHIASETSEGSYSVTIPGEVDKVMIRAAAGNPKAKVQINGAISTPQMTGRRLKLLYSERRAKRCICQGSLLRRNSVEDIYSDYKARFLGRKGEYIGKLLPDGRQSPRGGKSSGHRSLDSRYKGQRP